MTESRKQMTEDGRQIAEHTIGKSGDLGNRVQDISRPGSQDVLEMVRGFARYPLSDKDLRGFTLVLGVYCFDPCSPREIGGAGISPGESAESVVNDLFDNCRESSTNRPPFLQNKANLLAGQNTRKRSFDKGL